MEPLTESLLNDFQHDFPLTPSPFAHIARCLNTSTADVLARLKELQRQGTVSRVGPVFRPNTVGASTLAAMQVPAHDFERVTALVNAHPEVAHNYAREHDFNMWFVLATEAPEKITAVIAAIERETGCRVYNMPKLEEFFVGLRFEA